MWRARAAQARATHVQQVVLDLAVVDWAVSSAVELDQVPVVVDESDEVQVGLVLECRSLFSVDAERGIASSVAGPAPTMARLGERDAQLSDHPEPSLRVPARARSRSSRAERVRAESGAVPSRSVSVAGALRVAQTTHLVVTL